MRTVLCVGCVGVLLTGCFYIDPINRRPKILGYNCKIKSTDAKCPQSGSVHRGDLLVVDANFIDEDNIKTTASFNWQALECTDPEATQCSEFHTGKSSVFEIEVPITLTGVPAIRVELELRDELGAFDEETEIYAINDPPTLEVDKRANGFVVGGPVELYATVGDLDEGPDRIALSWDVIAPAPSAVPLEELVVPPTTNPLLRTHGKLLVPDRTGDWDVRIRATDTVPDLEETTERHLTFSVGPDQPPCLAQSLPLVPPDGASMPISEPTLFQVAVVVDDLDPYPPRPGPHFGTTAFEWSILAPSSPGRQILTGATGNSVDFDPSAFTPGEIVELRVEISDRKDTPIPCADGVATCAISQPACIQRQTWRVEVR